MEKSMIVDRVRETIVKNNLIEKGDRVVVALSGGPDSVFLLHVLDTLKKEFEIEIFAAHLNHRIRGIDAHEDALFVANLCEKMGIPCFIKSIDVISYCNEHGLSLEQGARDIRYSMFFHIKDEIKADKIAIGHNQNDQAETMLMRIMRGAGLHGLRGIEYRRNDGIIRPILDISRDEIEKYCEEYELNPRIDKTNLESIYTRNKIRLDLIPYMKKEFNENIVNTLVRMGYNIKEDDDFIASESNRYFSKLARVSKGEVVIPAGNFENLHISMKTRIIIKAIESILGDTKDFSRSHIMDAVELAGKNKNHKHIELPRGIFVYRKENRLIITDKVIENEKIEFEYKISVGAVEEIKELNRIISLETVSKNEFDEFMKSEKNGKRKLDERKINSAFSKINEPSTKDAFEEITNLYMNSHSLEDDKVLKDTGSFIKYIDFDKLKGDLVVRNRRSGDKIKLNGGTKKLKNLFIDLKIPREERDKVIIFVDSFDGGEEVVLVSDYRMSEDYKVSEDTGKVLKIEMITG